MTELEFKNTNPTSYEEGNANLLYSSSIGTGSFELPEGKYGASGSFSYDQILDNPREYYLADALFPPYKVLGLTIPFNSDNNVSLEQTLSEVTRIKLTVGNAPVTLVVNQISKQSGYFYIRTNPKNIMSLPTGLDQSGTPLDVSVEFIFSPYLASKFSNSDFNALINNASTNKVSNVAMVVDRASDQLTPTNLDAVITKTATNASVQYSNYTTTGWTNARYYGTNLDSGSIIGDDPALTLKAFKGSIHPLDSDNNTLLEAVEQDSTDIYFSVDRKPTSLIQPGSAFISASSFPDASGSYNPSGSILYQARGTSFVVVVEKKILATDESTIYTTNEFGNIIFRTGSS